MPAPGSELTFQANRKLARHAWLHLTPAYAADLVSHILNDADPQEHILDPFAGSGTTVIRASQLGIASTAWDINPFLLDLITAKSTQLDQTAAEQLLQVAHTCVAFDRCNDLCPPPPMHNLERWWPQPICLRLQQLKTAIQLCDCEEKMRRLLLHAFAACVKASAQVDHKHHSLSFSEKAVDCAIDELFIKQIAIFAADCQTPLPIIAELQLHDARSARSSRSFDRVICSPPYPNRMSYIRELRPYLYWLDYVQEAHECADMDWDAIGGTWGTATNRLKTWSATHQAHMVPSVSTCIDQIPEEKSSALIRQYLERYAFDMYEHFTSLKHILSADARLDYIIGNAFYYGAPFASDQVYSELLERCGYRDIHVSTLRRRSSSKALFEYRVSARAPHSGCCAASLLT